MEDLKHYCQNWGERVCHPEVAKWKRPFEIKNGEGYPNPPAHSILDKICRECKSHHFVVDEKVCPKCDSPNVEKSGGAHKTQGMVWLYGFICQDCKTYFWIPEGKF